MGLSAFPKIPLIGSIIFRLWLWDARHKFRRISRWLPSGGHLLEVGSGLGTVFLTLKAAGYSVTALDVANHSFKSDLRPIIYDGRRFPFDDNAFEVILLLTVLHHTQDPCQVLREAARVGQRVIVIEDIYRHTLQKRLTMAMDSLANLEWAGHPHNNRTDTGWREVFDELGLTLTATDQWSFLLFFRQALYILEKP